MNKIKNLIVIGGPILIGLGAIKQILFYRSFNLNIVDFLDLTEILILFLDDIFYIVIMMIMGALFEILQTTRFEIIKIESLKSEIKVSKNIFKRIPRYYRLFKEGIWILVFLGLLDLLILIFLKNRNTYVHDLFIFVCILLIIMISWTEIKLKIHKLYDFEINATVNNIVVIGVIVSMFFYSLIRGEINQVKNEKIYYGTEIHYVDLNKKTKFVSDSINYYIGKSKNYIFIYQEPTNSTHVIPIKNIYKLIIKKK